MYLMNYYFIGAITSGIIFSLNVEHTIHYPNKPHPARITSQNTKQSPSIHSQHHPIHHNHQFSNQNLVNA